MREIKFRAWHKVAEIMLPDEKVNNLRFCIRNENVDLMQFTGLKDCNGKEIYEGDIVIPFSLENKMNKSIIVYEFNQFRIKGENLYWNWDLRQIEIIGNIYEMD